MAIICPVCNNIYSDEYDYIAKCPMERCNDEPDDLIRVDDAIAPIVVEFNKKGWSVYCAEFGNPINQMKHKSFIMFDKFLLEDDMYTEDELRNILSELPKSWGFKVKDGCPTIEMDWLFNSDIERAQRFIGAWLDLAKFAKNMDELCY